MSRTITVQTKFFEFDQNNSGGSFVIDDKLGIGPHVWIEAQDWKDANRRAEDLGIYFNGCQTGQDCDCCGDRWSAQWDGEKGEPEPKVNEEYDFSWHPVVYVHPYDGSFKRLRPAIDHEAQKKLGAITQDKRAP